MNISNIGNQGATPPIKSPEAAEPKGPDLKNDHDADDGAAVTPGLPREQGTKVDKTV